MSTHGHLTAIREILESYFGGPITEGNPNAMPAGFAILHHAEALAAELEAERDFEHAEFNLMTRSWEQAQAALEAERARVARHQWSIAAYRENVYEAFGGDEACPEVVSESEQMLTAEDREAIHDLPDEEASDE